MFPQLVRTAARFEGQFAAMFLKHVRRGRKRINRSYLAGAIERGEGVTVSNHVDIAANTIRVGLLEDVPVSYGKLLVAGYDVAAKAFNKGDHLRTAKQGIKFSLSAKNPRAIAWAQRHAAELVQGIDEETRAAIREIVRTSLAEGLPPGAAAKLVQANLGLNTQQADAVRNLWSVLNASAGKTVVAGTLRIRVPKTGATNQLLDKSLTRYADKLTKSRAKMIARTETIRASNAGQRLLWQEARERGYIGDGARQQWLAVPDGKPCPICTGLDGETAAIDGTFSDGSDGPPAHPSCRCTTTLVFG